MSKFTVDCSWEMYGHIDVEADSVEEAIKSVEKDINLSEITADYVSESFQVDYDTTLDQAGPTTFHKIKERIEDE
jgi:hypothetical protein|tara:strand:- start:688 stop:912 length:225 start_codon:yes stop_codon:yes gene_type:complete